MFKSFAKLSSPSTVRKIVVVKRKKKSTTSSAAASQPNPVSSSVTLEPPPAELSLPTADLLPPCIRSDEDSLRCLGVASLVSPEIEGFTGHFRQLWQDYQEIDLVASGKPVPEDSWEAIEKHEIDLPNLDQLRKVVFGKNANAEKETVRSDIDLRNVSEYFTECTVRRCHVSHQQLIDHIVSVLNVDPSSISFATVREGESESVQRIRIRNVSPEAVLTCNFPKRSPPSPDLGVPQGTDDEGLTSGLPTLPPEIKKAEHGQEEKVDEFKLQEARLLRDFGKNRELPSDAKMTFSSFRYAGKPLSTADAFGTEFKVVLRGVNASSVAVERACTSVALNGFANFYGPSRFHFFGGAKDATIPLLQGDVDTFAYRLLEYTTESHSLCQLLQRFLAYPTVYPNLFRRLVVQGLQKRGLTPAHVDYHFPPEHLKLALADRVAPSSRKDAITAVLRRALHRSAGKERKAMLRQFPSYMWNQVLTARGETIGLRTVLIGDLVVPASELSQPASALDDCWQTSSLQLNPIVVTEDNIADFTIFDVVHPSFCWNNSLLPDNDIQYFYSALCSKYGLPWSLDPASVVNGSDFNVPPRHIVVKPTDFDYTYDQAAETLSLRFSLPRGADAPLLVHEILKGQSLPGMDAIQVKPLHARWWDYGSRDPSAVKTFEDFYLPSEYFYTDDRSLQQDSAESFLEEDVTLDPTLDDEVAEIARWSKQHLVRNGLIPERELESMKDSLFEPALAETMTERELNDYAGHTVPLRPNDSIEQFKPIIAKRRRDAQRGTPEYHPYIEKKNTSKHSVGRASYVSLHRGAWNRMS